MVNKKLSTTLCNITFNFGEFSDPAVYRLWEDNGKTRRINHPEPQFKYLYDTVEVPTGLSNNTELYVETIRTGQMLKYKLTWKDYKDRDFVFSDPVNGDTEIIAHFEEVLYTIHFEFSNPVGYVWKNGCAKERLPNDITGIPNNGTVDESRTNNYGNDYTKNEFEYGTEASSDGLRHRFTKIRWTTGPYGTGSEFRFKTSTSAGTPVTEDITIYPAWTIKTWTITIDYNRSYYSDKIASYLPSNDSIMVYDGFRLRTSPNYNLNTVREKLSKRVNISGYWYLSEQPNPVQVWRQNNNISIKTYSVWYTDANRQSAFDFNKIINRDEHIYAKWGNIGTVEYKMWMPQVYDSTSKNYTYHNTSSVGNFLIPSFSNKAELFVTSGGGNSRLIYGAETDPEWKEKVECILSNPGTQGTTWYFGQGNYSKVPFEYQIGGSQKKSYLKNRSSGTVLSPPAGSSGGSETHDGNTRFNLGDSGASEEAFTGGGTIFSYMVKRVNPNAIIYTKTVTFGTSYCLFRGICNNYSTLNTFRMDVYFIYYLGGYYREKLIGYVYYRDRDNDSKSWWYRNYGWLWADDTILNNNNPFRDSYQAYSGSDGGVFGFGGHAIYITCKDHTDSKANSTSLGYGNTGGIRIVLYDESANIGNFS